MSIFSTLKSIFAGADQDSAKAEAEAFPAVEYKGFTITPAPVAKGSQYRVSGTIVKGDQTHTFIRADTLSSALGCSDEMVRKAKQMIDQQGDNIF